MTEMTRRQISVVTQSRAAAASSYDAEAHTVDLTILTDAQIKMPAWRIGIWDTDYFYEVLDMGASSVDLSQVEAGNAPLLDAHSRYSIDDRLGAVKSARIEGDALVASVEFSRSDRAQEIERDFAPGGTPPKVSGGYRVKTYRFDGNAPDGLPIYRAIEWTFTEASLVPIAADPSAGVRSDGEASPCVVLTPPSTSEETRNMNTRTDPAGTPAAETEGARAAPVSPEMQAAIGAAVAAALAGQRAAPVAVEKPAVEGDQARAATFTVEDGLAFVDQARSLGVEDQARELVGKVGKGEIGIEAARSALLKAAADKQKAETALAPAGAAARADDGNRELTRAAVVEALCARALGRTPKDFAGKDGKVVEGSAADARPYMGYRMLELAAERAGLGRDVRDPTDILRAAHSTSDFPLVLEAASNKILLERYQVQAPTYQAIAKRRDLRDFKQTKLLRIGDFPTLKEYTENGEIQAGTINEGRETVILASYGRIVRISRQAIVNDDLGAFDEVFGNLGTVISLFENATFFTMKGTVGPTLADGKAVFHSGHGNLAGSGTVIDVTNLSAARAAIRKQTNLDGANLNLTPKILLVGPDKETQAEQIVAPLVPAQNSNVNPFSGKLQIVTEGSIAGNAWEVYADPAIAPVWAYGYLADAPGPRVLTEEPFNVDGIAMRVTLDFYAGATDYRGGYRNPGA